MTTTISGPAKEDQGVVHCTVSSRAGRLLFALLLSPSGLGSPDTVTHLSKLANIPTKQLPACIDEISVVEQSPGLENAVDAAVIQTASNSIVHKEEKKLVLLNDSHNYLVPDPSGASEEDPFGPEGVVEKACMEADEIEDPLARVRSQALAVVRAWEFFFPEVNKVQGLQPRKAKEWVKLAGSSATVFGWLGGVDEGKLLSMQFPLAYANKMIANKAAEYKANVGEEDEVINDNWRQMAKENLDEGINERVGEQLKSYLHSFKA